MSIPKDAAKARDEQAVNFHNEMTEKLGQGLADVTDVVYKRGFDDGFKYQQEKVEELEAANTQLADESRKSREHTATLIKALQFYADGRHIEDHEDSLESVSGEPLNILCDADGKFTLESGGIAVEALKEHANTSDWDYVVVDKEIFKALQDEVQYLQNKHDAGAGNE